MKAAENGISKIRFPSSTKYISVKKSPEINRKAVGIRTRQKIYKKVALSNFPNNKQILLKNISQSMEIFSFVKGKLCI